MKKSLREKVHKKYDGHCGYCGKEIAYKDMQVDHIFPKAQFSIYEAITGSININDFENLMPSCRRCNHYKRDYNLEQFREKMKTLHERIMKQYINKVGVDFGIITIQPFDGIFYFEKFFKKT